MLFIDALESEEEMRALCALPGAAARLPKVWLQCALCFVYRIYAERQRCVPDVPCLVLLHVYPTYGISVFEGLGPMCQPFFYLFFYLYVWFVF